MSTQLSDMPNIGKTLEKMLRSVGIMNAEDLKKIGSVEACKKLKLSGVACYNKLYALEGAIQNIRWHELPKEFRKKLKARYDSTD